MDGSITDTGPRLGLDGDAPADGDMGIGDVTEDGDLALSVDRTTDGAVVGESDVNCVCARHLFYLVVKWEL